MMSSDGSRPEPDACGFEGSTTTRSEVELVGQRNAIAKRDSVRGDRDQKLPADFDGLTDSKPTGRCVCLISRREYARDCGFVIAFQLNPRHSGRVLVLLHYLAADDDVFAQSILRLGRGEVGGKLLCKFDGRHGYF